MRTEKRRSKEAAARFVAAISTMLIGAQLLAAPDPTIDVSSTSAGFTYSKRIRAGEGRSEDWTLNLYPNGKLSWKGNHRPQAPHDCSADAGLFETKLDPKTHGALVEMALQATEEQKKLKAPTRKEGRGPHEPYVFLHTELGERSESAEVVRSDGERLQAFLKASNKALTELLALQTAPTEAVAVQVIKKGPLLEVTLQNIGFQATPIVLPEEAEEAFHLRTGRTRSGLAYASAPKDTIVVLEPKKSVTVKLKIPPGGVPKGALVVYDNLTIRHHAESNQSPLPVTLCAKAGS